MPDAIQTSISTNAQAPASARSDAGSVTQHPLGDQIEADKYLSAKAALAKKHRGVRVSQMRPPGALGV